MTFTYVAFDKAGKSVNGKTDAATEAEARDALRKQGYFVTSITAGKEGASSGIAVSGPRSGKAIKIGKLQRLNQLARFSRQLQVLIASGTPLVQALQAIERQTDHEG